MGITYVTAIVRNPADPELSWTSEFMVDTGAIDCLVPEANLAAIGLAPRSERVYSLADGSEIRLGVTVGEIELMGEIVGATVVCGPPDSEPLLGVTALESAGVEVDPVNETLRKMPFTRLRKGMIAHGE